MIQNQIYYKCNNMFQYHRIMKVCYFQNQVLIENKCVWRNLDLTQKFKFFKYQFQRDKLLGFIHQGLYKGQKQTWMNIGRLLICFNKLHNTQMTNILLILYDLEIKNNQIIQKDRSIQNLHGVLEKEQKFKTKLQVKKHENNEVLVELQIVRQNNNNMEKHNKDLEKIRMKIDSL